ncbi:Uma2 family endonuclease [Crocosphaera sp. Alani8]|uniref:Uma2 family endonuclease n=1 Tax=Crocosphaera sp. Alani8 TaxID=3038952 RepID=UPI00313DDA37
MLLELKRFEIPPGQTICLKDVTWDEFEQILEELGDHRASRIAYHDHILEIMTPLPEHERNKEIISDLIKILLEELDIEFCTLGSTTFKNELMQQGIEPDNCFYIENEAKIRGKDRLDLTVDPPPDIALEIDVTSRTHREIYSILGVRELWRFEQGELEINVLENGNYKAVVCSLYFPNFPLKKIIPCYLEKVKKIGRNKTIKEFRQWVNEQAKNL